MDKKYAIDKLVQQVKDYAIGRARNVARGAETPYLAALLLQKYGLGVAKAVAVIFDSQRAADPIFKVLDEETSKIDPLWREHNQDRWTEHPADIVPSSFGLDSVTEKMKDTLFNALIFARDMDGVEYNGDFDPDILDTLISKLLE